MSSQPYTRKLVTIQQITAITDIPGADLIASATIQGWQVIVKKSEFKVNDLCLFFEIDSFLPLEPRYEFLKKTTKFEGKEGYRLKTMKMKGTLSQGLALPLSMFPEITSPQQDFDYSLQLNVIKYDNEQQEYSQKPGLKAGKPRGSFPSFIPKTDQPRIQNLVTYFSTMTDEEFEETLKLDGSSMTCYKVAYNPSRWEKFKSFFGFKHPENHFGVCSRNLELKRTANATQTFDNQGKVSVYDQSDFWSTAIKYKIESKLPAGYAIQGELIGPKIQANHEKVTELQYFVFDVFNIKTGLYLLPTERREFCALHNIPHVPVISKKFKPLQLGLDTLLKHVEGQSMNPGTVSEGRVYKHTTKPISFKAISNNYLLGKKDWQWLKTLYN